MTIVFFWIALSVVVGVAAHSKGHSGVGWCVIALCISPLIAGLLIIALSSGSAPAKTAAVAFHPTGVLQGVPYRVLAHGRIEAMMPGGLVSFRNVDQLAAALQGQTIQAEEHPELVSMLDNGIRYRVGHNGAVTALLPEGLQHFDSWKQFWMAAHR